MTLQELSGFYRGRTILVTGHTGFKGSWLCHTLNLLGARVAGIALPPATPRDIFVLTGLGNEVDHHELDIRDSERLFLTMRAVAPDIVFHLAAQPLVRQSYDEPLATMTTNVIGTANVLDAVRQLPAVTAAVIITTDKVYENREWIWGYRESDALGGHDPYSGSKAAADIVAQSYLRSYFNPAAYGTTHETLVAIARAGNVIGGGDWSNDRLVPDIMRTALYGDGQVTLRHPDAVRPWEHVLEPLAGYLRLGQLLAEGKQEISGAWNFGPDISSWRSVGEVTVRLLALMGKGSFQFKADHSKHEATMLTLDTTKAHRQLGWRSRLDFQETLRLTAEWYSAVAADESAATLLTKRQIETYFQEEK